MTEIASVLDRVGQVGPAEFGIRLFGASVRGFNRTP